MLITLEAARKNIGYSQKEAAALFGVHYQTLAKLEEDSSNAPYSFIQLIPKIYKVSKCLANASRVLVYPKIFAISFPTKYGSLLIVIVRISPNSGLLKIFKSFMSLTPFLLHPPLVFFRMTINVFFDVPHQRIHAAYLLIHQLSPLSLYHLPLTNE